MVVSWRGAGVLASIAVLGLILHLALGGDGSRATSAPATPPASGDAASAPAVLLAAGDIACGSTSQGALCAQAQTADVIASHPADAILTLGDNQYECGSPADYAQYFGSSWGRFKDRLYPAIGNHEYNVTKDAEGNCTDAAPGAPGYWGYFGDRASPLDTSCTLKCKGYYSFDLGAWHIIALNDQCSRVGGCDKGSPEEQWLVADLASHAATCTLAYFHEPRFSSGNHGDITASSQFWDDLYAAGVDVVLNGHDHDYERFAPQTPSGAPDPNRGIREFVVGTGGRNHTGVGKPGIAPNSEVFDGKTFGLLKLTLSNDRYTWEFLPVAGGTFTDTGSGTCH